MKTNEIVSEASPVTNFARRVGGAVKGAVTLQNPAQAGQKAVDQGDAKDMLDAQSKDTISDWNQATKADPSLVNDEELYNFMQKYRHYAPEAKWVKPAPNTAQNDKLAREYIRKLIGIELAAGQFGKLYAQGIAPGSQGGTQDPNGTQGGDQTGGKLTPGSDNAEQVTTQDPKMLPIGTQFTDTQNNTYKWEGQQWTKLVDGGKWQGGQIKNKIAWDLYLQAVKQGKALAPIGAKPDPAMAAKSQGAEEPQQAQEPEQAQEPQQQSPEFKQISDWVAKQNKTTVNAILKQLGA